MKTKRIPLAVFALVLGLAPMAMAAPACSVKDKVPVSALIFAKTSGQGAWNEYRSVSDVPQVMLDSGMTAQVMQHKKTIPSVTIVEPGEDFWLYTRYCFDEEGQLNGVSLELRTSLGWGHRVEGTVSGDEFIAGAAEFFSTKNGKPISRPFGVADVPAELKPTLYTKLSELPFAPLLKTASISHAKRSTALSLASSGN